MDAQLKTSMLFIGLLLERRPKQKKKFCPLSKQIISIILIVIVSSVNQINKQTKKTLNFHGLNILLL